MLLVEILLTWGVAPDDKLAVVCWTFKPTRVCFSMVDITVNAELDRLAAAVLWNVRMDCRMSLGIDTVQSEYMQVGSK